MPLEILRAVGFCVTIVIIDFARTRFENFQECDDTLFVCETGMDCMDREE